MSWRKHLVEEISLEGPTTYRIFIMPDAVKVSLVGLGPMVMHEDNRMEVGWFNSVDNLPQWAQERLCMLTMCNVDRGRNKREDVPGIGRIISSDIFWIYA